MIDQVVKSFLLAMQFLTRLPIDIKGEVQPGDMARSVVWYPVIGSLLALLLVLLHQVAARLWPGMITGALLVGAEFLFSGGLHLDGLSDLADGWFGSADRERWLAIMKDSRIGAAGAVSLVLVVLLKAVLLGSVGGQLLPLLLYGAGAKLVMVFCIHLFPYARSVGTGALLRKVSRWQVCCAGLFCLILLTISPVALIVIFLLALTLSLGCARFIASRLGGLTGDCYGALHEVFQLILLLGVGAGH